MIDEVHDAVIVPKEIEHLGEPDATLGGFRLWVHGYQFPALHGDWLEISAYCTAGLDDGWAAAFVRGPILQCGDIAWWIKKCVAINERVRGTAKLHSYEGDIDILCEFGTLGHLATTVGLRATSYANRGWEYGRHAFCFDLDQTYLSAFIRNLEAILAKYPPRSS